MPPLPMPMNVAMPDTFTCSSGGGQVIPAGRVGDGAYDCPDGSDEDSLITVKERYREQEAEEKRRMEEASNLQAVIAEMVRSNLANNIGGGGDLGGVKKDDEENLTKAGVFTTTSRRGLRGTSNRRLVTTETPTTSTTTTTTVEDWLDGGDTPALLILGVLIVKKAGDEVRSLRGREDGVSICGHIKARLLSICWLDGANSGRLCHRGKREKNGGGGGELSSSSFELKEGYKRRPTPRKKKEMEEEHKQKGLPSLDDTATTASTSTTEKDFTWELAVPKGKGEGPPQQPGGDNQTQQKKKAPK